MIIWVLHNRKMKWWLIVVVSLLSLDKREKFGHLGQEDRGLKLKMSSLQGAPSAFPYFMHSLSKEFGLNSVNIQSSIHATKGEERIISQGEIWDLGSRSKHIFLRIPDLLQNEIFWVNTLVDELFEHLSQRFSFMCDIGCLLFARQIKWFLFPSKQNVQSTRKGSAILEKSYLYTYVLAVKSLYPRGWDVDFNGCPPNARYLVIKIL